MQPLVSILIPCYNAERFVADAIESGLNQTYTNVEVVVVDDGSTDGSVKVLESFGNRIRFEVGPNQGGCAARNRAFALARGEFVQFLDADDRLESVKLERQLPLLLSGEVDVVLCKMGLFGDDRGPRPVKRPQPDPVGDPFLHFARYPTQTAAPLYRRSWFEKVGGFRVGLPRGQEYELHLRLGARSPRLGLVEEILVWVRMHDGPRVTQYQPTAAQNLELIYGVATDLVENALLTPARAEWISQTLFQAARSAYHEGATLAAVRSFDLAKRIDPTILSNETLLLRLIRRWFGFSAAEKFVSCYRAAKGRSGIALREFDSISPVRERVSARVS